MVKKKTKSKTSKRPAGSNQTCISASINNEVIAEALSSVNQPVLLKVCRLCESKDGPFLNIFDSDKVTAKIIEDLMPFVITENDDLPHKICFRCSAKVVELHEFIQKCINTQDNLRTAVGQKGPVPLKTKTRKIWEQKLNKSNMTNDDICDALIKKAMESIKDIPLNPVSEEELPPVIPSKPENNIKPTSSTKEVKVDVEDDIVLEKEIKSSFDKCDERKTRSSRSKTIDPKPEEPKKTVSQPVHKVVQQINKKQSSSDSGSESDVEIIKQTGNNVKTPVVKESELKPQDPSPTFNIMDHVSKITVNGVGILFQCKLCNRNFLKKDVVLSHDCAKKGKPKVDFTKHIVPPEPPKVSTVKYIKMDADFRKSLSNNAKLNVKNDSVDKNIPEDKEEMKNVVPVAKPKPRAGPASKVKHNVSDLSATIGMTVRHQELAPEPFEPDPPVQPITVTNPNYALPTLSIPGISNTSFKLVVGPNNILTLVADKPENPESAAPETITQVQQTKKRKSEEVSKPPEETKSNMYGERTSKIKSARKPSPPEVDMAEESKPKPNQPYPVGLFQTVSHHSSIYVPPVPVETPTFTTPAMKKQSYKVVQTGNPSKLLISTKTQPEEEPSKKRQRKSKYDIKPELGPKQPYSVTLEDSNQQKDPGFFTFINVDPLLQPSYVLPTDNIIQESQITTSTPVSRNAEDPKDKYSCNMCGEKFSREKKLLTHIQSHYSKMDEEDQEREKVNRKKGKK